MSTESTAPAAYAVEMLTSTKFRVILRNKFGQDIYRFESFDSCVTGARAAATRHGRRPLRFDGVIRTRNGVTETVAPSDVPACKVDLNIWPGNVHHAHLHR